MVGEKNLTLINNNNNKKSMKKQLLMKTFLVAVSMLVGTSAWAETKDIVEVYNFTSWGQAHMTKGNNTEAGYATMGTTAAGFSVNDVEMNKLHITSNKNSDTWDLGDRFAVSSNVTYRWGKGSSDLPRLGNENGSGVRYISIVGLNAGDRVTLTCSNVKFYSTNATYMVETTPTAVTSDASVTSGTEYTISGTGSQRLDLSIASSTWGNITKVVVKRNVEVKEVYRWTLTGSDGNVVTNSEKINANGADHYAATAPTNCVGLYFYDSWKVYSSAGLRNISNGDRSLVIPNLKASDVIVFTGNDGMTTNHSAMYSGVVDGSTVTFSMENDGNFWFKMAKTTSSDVRQITSIVVYRELKEVTATIPTSGYGTIASAYPLDCANLPDGLKAYKVTELTAETVTLEEVTTAVAAGTGLILKGTAGETYNIPVAATGTDISETNKLQAAVTATAVEANETYILQGGQFHKVTAASTIPAGKAYLRYADLSMARELTLTFGDATGIGATLKNKEIENKEVYNLKGQRVAQPTKGLYIQNGKKVIVK